MSSGGLVTAFLRAAAKACEDADADLVRHGIRLAGRFDAAAGSRTHLTALPDLDGEAFAQLRSSRPPEVNELVRLLHLARHGERAARAEDAAPVDGEQDPVTGLGGARVWDRFVFAEGPRSQQFAHPCTVLVAESPWVTHRSDPHGEASRAQRAARALRRSLREHDLLCRLQPTLFALFTVECTGLVADRVVTRVREGLLEVGLASAIGAASHDPASDPASANQIGAISGLLDRAVQLMHADRERQRVVPL